MTQDIATLGLRIDARQVAEGDRALDKFDRTGQRADANANKLNATMARMARAAAAVAAALSVREIVAQADAYASMQGRLALVTRGSQDLAEKQDALFKMAQRTRSELSATVGLYAKLTSSTRELNKTDAERMRVVETINKGFVVSGAGAVEAAQAVRQLGQAFDSGVLRGEEFNAVMEGAPRLADAIAAGMGRAKGELRAMAAEGKLSAEAVFNALLTQSTALDTEFERMPKTVAQGMTQVQNAVLQAIGVFDQANQLSAGFAGSLTALANNIGSVVAALAGLATTAALVWLRGMTAGLIAKASAALADAAATRAAAAAGVAAAAARVNETAATVAATTARLAEVRAATLAATGNTQLALTLNGLVPAQARAAAAAAAHTAALAAQGRAAGVAAAATGIAGRALSFLGGPVGILIGLLGTGVAAWMAWGDSAKDEATTSAKTIHDTTAEIVADLDAQIKKLDELNRLKGVNPTLSKAEGPVADQQRALAARMAEVGKDKTLNGAARTEILRVLGAEYNALSIRAAEAADKQAKFDATTATEKRGAWLKKNTQYMTDAEKITHALAEAQAELGTAFTAADEARIRASFGKKADGEAQRKAEEQRKTALDYLAGLEDERRAIGATEQQLTMLAAARAAAAAPADQRVAIMENALALTVEREAHKTLTEQKERAEALDKQRAAADVAEITAANERVVAMQKEIETYGMGEAAVTRYTLAKLREKEATVVKFGGDNDAELSKIRAVIQANEEVLKLQDKKADLDAMFDVAKVESFGDALRDAFGSAGSSLGKLTDMLQAYQDNQKGYEKERAAAVRKYAGDETRTAKAIAKINDKADAERIGAFADMAGAAKGFFKEHTTGYKLMEGAERAFRLLELANQMQSLYTHLFVTGAKATATVGGQAVETAAVGAGETARNALKVPGVFMSFMSALGPWGAAAAGIAIAAVLGGAFSGGGSSAPRMSAKDRQAAAGTGSVLGDDSAKSESIANALDKLESNSSITLTLTSNMLASLRTISSGISGMAAMVARASGLRGTSADEKALGVGSSKGALGFSSKSTTLDDQGIAFAVGQTVSSILAAGIKATKYADLTSSKSSFWGLSKSSSSTTQTEALGDDLTKQMSLTVADMVKTVRVAALGLGVSADGLEERLAAVGLGFDKISLKGLSGEEIEKQLQAVFGSFGDSLARTALEGGLDQFQKAGEGYLETLVRVATDSDVAREALDRFGFTMIGLPDLVDKQGDVAAELVRQTVLASIPLGGVADIMRTLAGDASELAATYGELLDVQNAMTLVGLDATTLGRSIIRGAGDLGGLQSGLDSYFENFFTESEQLAAKTAAMSKQFAALGVAMPTTGAGFRALIESSGPQLTGQLLMLSDGLAELLETTGGDAFDSAFAAVERAVDAERDLKEKAHAAFMDTVEASLKASQDRVSKLTTVTKALGSFIDNLKVPGTELASRGVAQADLQTMLALARAGSMPDADKLQKVLSTLSQDVSGSFSSELEYKRDMYKTANGVAELAAVTGDALSVEERNLAALERVKETAERLHDAEMTRLDRTLELAQQQIDIANGTYTATLSVAEAIRALDGLLAKSNVAGVGSLMGKDAISKSYQSLLGRAPDSAGLAFWESKLADGISQAAIDEAIKNSPEAVNWRNRSSEQTNTSSGSAARVSDASSEVAPDLAETVAAAVKDALLRPLYEIAKNTGYTADATKNIDRIGVETRTV